MATAELPEELISEILPWLPVKSIKRFRCLSKPLCAVIDSPQFIDSHFSKSSQNFNLHKLIFLDGSRKEFHVCDLNLDLEEEVLRLENPWFQRNIESKFDIEVWICGLKSNSWRKSQNWEFSNSLPGNGCFTPIDGIIHWISTVQCCIHEIVAFDVRKETFSILPSPDCSLNLDSDFHYPPSTALHVLEGCLCIIYVNALPFQADLYIRRKEGDQFAWTQLFSVIERLFVGKIWFRTLKVLGHLKRGDKIMLDLGMGHLVSFDLKEKTFGNLVMDKDSNWMAPILCIESLVPLS